METLNRWLPELNKCWHQLPSLTSCKSIHSTHHYYRSCSMFISLHLSGMQCLHAKLSLQAATFRISKQWQTKYCIRQQLISKICRSLPSVNHLCTFYVFMVLIKQTFSPSVRVQLRLPFQVSISRNLVLPAALLPLQLHRDLLRLQRLQRLQRLPRQHHTSVCIRARKRRGRKGM